MADDGPTPLDYAAPTIFFSGVYRSRTLGTLLGGSLCLLLGAASAVAAGSVTIRASRLGLASAAAFFVLLGLACLWQWIADDERPVRVTAHGIEIDRVVWPWERIARVEGHRWNLGVLVAFHTRGGISTARLVHTTPPLDDDAFHALRVELDHYFRTRGIPVEVVRDIQPFD